MRVGGIEKLDFIERVGWHTWRQSSGRLSRVGGIHEAKAMGGLLMAYMKPKQ